VQPRCVASTHLARELPVSMSCPLPQSIQLCSFRDDFCYMCTSISCCNEDVRMLQMKYPSRFAWTRWNPAQHQAVIANDSRRMLRAAPAQSHLLAPGHAPFACGHSTLNPLADSRPHTYGSCTGEILWQTLLCLALCRVLWCFISTERCLQCQLLHLYQKNSSV
jgi:hypothetical protein